MPLYGIYVFHENGQLMFSKDFPHEALDGLKRSNPNLITGLMAALGTIAHSIGGGGIRNIQMDNFGISGIVSPKFCVNFLAICDIDDSRGQVHGLLKKARASFTRKHAKLLRSINKGCLVNTDDFIEWDTNLNKILQNFDFENIEDLMAHSLKDIVSVFKKDVKKAK